MLAVPDPAVVNGWERNVDIVGVGSWGDCEGIEWVVVVGL